jgi:low temperature requirement protein LtrA
VSTSVRSALLGLRPAGEGDRVTTLELFFDLVYVFAFTQVTGLMSHGTAPGSILDGFIVFALLWWTWCSYSWLANMARGDAGVMRLALMAASAAMFVACLAIAEALHDQPGGLNGPLVLVACYAVVRLIHIGVYLVVAGDDRALRRQVLVLLTTSAIPAALLLTVGVLLGEPWQRPIWLVAVVALAVAIGVWLHYFLGLADRLEHGLTSLSGAERARAARDVFTYLHLPIVGGIILAALGIEQSLAHLGSGHVGTLGSWALGGGLALSLAGMAVADRRIGGRWSPWRIGAVAALLIGAALLPSVHPTLALGAWRASSSRRASPTPSRELRRPTPPTGRLGGRDLRSPTSPPARRAVPDG